VNWSAVCRAGNQRRGRALLPSARSRHPDSQLGNDAADALALREIESGLCALSATCPDLEARTLVALVASTGDALKPAQRDLLVPPPLSAQSAGPTLSASGQRSSHRWRHRIGVGRAGEQCDRRMTREEPGGRLTEVHTIVGRTYVSPTLSMAGSATSQALGRPDGLSRVHPPGILAPLSQRPLRSWSQDPFRNASRRLRRAPD
jgi:hypothetical protein